MCMESGDINLEHFVCSFFYELSEIFFVHSVSVSNRCKLQFPLQEKADAAAKEAEVAKTAWSCRICLSAEVDAAMVPCGHVLCSRCSASVQRCPFCRAYVTQKMKIYRP
jgi:Zinc finger, C3HC4 type (RING finger)